MSGFGTDVARFGMGSGADWPLIGRSGERAILVDQVLADPPRSVVVSGAAGVGRTRLAREALAAARAAGHPTRWATATAGAAAVPLGAFAHLVPTSGADHEGAGADQFALLQRALAALTRDRDRDRCAPVLVVDDAHLLDELSLTLLHQLATSGRVALVATTSTTGRTTDRLAGLWKDGAAGRLELEPLRRGDANRLLGAVLGDGVDTRTAQRLWRASRGHPLFLRELVEAGVHSGVLTDSSGIWRCDDDITPPPRLVDIVLAQLGESSPAERAALDVLAVGEPLDLTRFVSLSGGTAVAGLERRGLITVRRGSASPAHPLFGEVLRARITEVAARQVGRELAGPDGYADMLRTGRLARHGDPAPDPELLIDAAHRANAALDHRLAERLARAAVDQGAGGPACAELAESVLWQGRAGEAETLLDAARGREPGAARPAVLAAIALGLTRRRPTEAEATLAARSWPTPGPPPLVTATRALLAVRSGRPGSAVRLGREVLDGRPGRPGDPAEVLPTVLAAAATAAGFALLGRFADAADALARGRAALDPTGPDRLLEWTVLAHAELLGLRLSGRLPELEERAVELHRRSMTAPAWAGDALAAVALGTAALARGRLQVAERWLTEAVAGLRVRDPAGMLGSAVALLARARALRGDGPGAGALLEPPADRDGAEPMFSADVALARAWHAYCVGGAPDGARIALAAAEQARSRRARAAEAELLHAAVQLGEPAAAAARLAQLAGGRDATLVPLMAAHAAATGSGPELERVGRAFHERGALLAAADATAAAAAAYHRTGDRRRASRAGTEATTLAGECGGLRTPALAALTPTRLTGREAEIVRLATTGLANAAIARLLVLSVRTVEAHLAHAYAKLGVNSRRALRDAVGSALMPARRPETEAAATGDGAA